MSGKAMSATIASQLDAEMEASAAARVAGWEVVQATNGAASSAPSSRNGWPAPSTKSMRRFVMF